MEDIIGVDIGGTKTAIVYASCKEQICFKDKTVFETRTDLGLDYTLNRILDGIKAMTSRHSPRMPRDYTSRKSSTNLIKTTHFLVPGKASTPSRRVM